MERFAKLRALSSFILTGIARVWFQALFICHVNINLFLIKEQVYDIIDFYFLYIDAQKLLKFQINILLEQEDTTHHLCPRKRGKFLF